SWSKSKAALLVIPFATTCIGAFAILHPYGRSRHTAFLVFFIVTGVSIGLDRVLKSKVAPVLLGAFLLVPSWQVLNAGWYDSTLGREFGREYMTQALDYLDQQVPPGAHILTESESRVLLAHYLEVEGWLPETQGMPSEENLAGYRVLANPWNFGVPGHLDEDAAVIREHFQLDPAEPFWVVDGGFGIGLMPLLEDPAWQGRISELRWFGPRLYIFKLAGAPRDAL
ncbi:MAG: hypothetical protein GY953_47390, partial [bacterium]|nr:hypothetical protein [bacterium]